MRRGLPDLGNLRGRAVRRLLKGASGPGNGGDGLDLPTADDARELLKLFDRGIRLVEIVLAELPADIQWDVVKKLRYAQAMLEAFIELLLHLRDEAERLAQVAEEGAGRSQAAAQLRGLLLRVAAFLKEEGDFAVVKARDAAGRAVQLANETRRPLLRRAVAFYREFDTAVIAIETAAEAANAELERLRMGEGGAESFRQMLRALGRMTMGYMAILKAGFAHLLR